MIKVIIFDFDGVIVDSLLLKHQAFFDLFKNEDPKTRKIAAKIIEETRGRPRHQKFQEIFKTLKKPQNQINELIEEYAQKYNYLVQGQIAKLGPVKGAIETFNILSRKYNLHINSATPEPALKESLQKLQISQFFRGIHGLSLKNPHVPNFKVKNINKIAKFEKVKKSQIIFVGDAEIDLKAAIVSGCNFVGVTNGINKWENTRFPLITNINELVSLISNLNSKPSKLKIFGPNNHSVYKIKWKKIPKNLSSQIKELVAKWYHLTPVGEIKEVDQWEIRSNNFRLKVKSNEKKREVILKKHLRVNDPKSILLIDSVLDYLTKKKIKVTQIIKTKEGNNFFRHQDYYWQLYEFISGDHYRGTLGQLKDIARQIGRLHITLKKIPLSKKIARKINLNTPWSLKGWNKIFKVSSSKNQKIDKLVTNFKDLILETSNNLQKKSLTLGYFKKQVIRGDLHPHDTIYEDENFKAFLDFEGVRVGELARDVANALHRFVRQFVVYQNRPWEETLPSGMRTFLKGYQSVRHITDDEIELIPYFIQDETLRKIFRILTRYYLKNDSTGLKAKELEKQFTLLEEALIIDDILKEKL